MILNDNLLLFTTYTPEGSSPHNLTSCFAAANLFKYLTSHVINNSMVNYGVCFYAFYSCSGDNRKLRNSFRICA